MLRFPNPGSTIGNFVAVYAAAFTALHGRTVDLDDIVQATVEANLATSSGYMGSEAISRSTRTDRSRDPLYNQLKMYAELFRALGWLHPTPDSALQFTFTLLGRQIVAAQSYYLPLLGETVLGIAHPSHILSLKGAHDLRPIAFLLRTMLACNGALARDEMIVGPLSAASDRDRSAAEAMAAKIVPLRESSARIEAALDLLSRERGIQTNTLKNYTRWPIAIMRDCGWTEKVRLPYQRSGTFEAHKLTDEGKRIAQRLASAADLRVDQVDRLPLDEKAAISIESHYRMLERAGFDLSSVVKKLDHQAPLVASARKRLRLDPRSELLFSPFQSLSLEDIARIFPASEEASAIRARRAPTASGIVGRGSRDHLFVEPRFVRRVASSNATRLPLDRELRQVRIVHKSDEEAAAAFATAHATDTQTIFYPLVSELFQLMGFRSDYSRAGVNYQRWDACVWLNDFALPIEIKSPTEEAFLSTKAIRQALENKVILLARGGLNTHRDHASLIVGYQLPNERGDMSTLIDDIFAAFGLRIGVIDLKTLVQLAIRSVVDGVTVDASQLRALRGFLHV